MKRVAAIDCGTNSIRLLIAEQREPGTRAQDLVREMRIVRLGQGVDKTGMLAPEAIERTLAATREYADLIRQHDVTHVRFVATSASRDASNRNLFVDGVADILSIKPEVVPGHEEAALSFAGALTSVPTQCERPVMVVDIGGGSTELVIGNDTVEQAISINMGSVRVTEKFLAETDPTQGTPQQVRERACQWIDEQLNEAEKHVDFTAVRTLVGVAGTVTTVTAQALGLTSYQPERIDAATLSVECHQEAIDFFVNEPIAIKAACGFMPPGREDVIAAGALIWERVIERLRQRSSQNSREVGLIVTSEHDILDGIAASML